MMGPAPVQNLFIWSSSADEALAAATSLVEAALAWQHYAYQERMWEDLMGSAKRRSWAPA